MGGLNPDTASALIQQALSTFQAQGGGGAGGAGANGKPKVDVPSELHQMHMCLHQMRTLLAKICDHLNIPVPAQEMVTMPNPEQGYQAGGGPGGQPGAAPAGMAPPPGGGGIPPKTASELAQKYLNAGNPHTRNAFVGIRNSLRAAELLRDRH